MGFMGIKGDRPEGAADGQVERAAVWVAVNEGLDGCDVGVGEVTVGGCDDAAHGA